MSAYDDFGFTMHDDPGEVDNKWQVAYSAEQTRRINERNKIDEIMKIINPLLERLLTEPDKPYIKWANRAEKIEDIRIQLISIVERA